jgi:citrate lyase beta subunit
VRVEGQMVDAPVAKRARELVAYAEAIGASS